MIITRTAIEAYAHCGQQITDGEISLDDSGKPFGDERCPGYAQERVPAIRELVEFTYADGGEDPSQPVARMVERGIERLEWANPEDVECPYCHTPRELSEQQRPKYASLGGTRGGPDQLFADRRARREQTQAAQTTADASTRQAVALERANELEERRIAAQEEANRIELIKLNGNGNGPEQRPGDVKPRPRRQTS